MPFPSGEKAMLSMGESSLRSCFELRTGAGESVGNTIGVERDCPRMVRVEVGGNSKVGFGTAGLPDAESLVPIPGTNLCAIPVRSQAIKTRLKSAIAEDRRIFTF
jgi:hypothetical protein